MTFDQYKKQINQLNYTALGLNLIRVNRSEIDNPAPPPNKIITFICTFKNNFVEVSFEYIMPALSMDLWISKNQSDYFNLSEYLQHKNRHSELPLLMKQSHENEEQYVSRFLNFSVNLLKNELKPILDGQAWEKVSRDWMGYR
jgi:hypothetical protein